MKKEISQTIMDVIEATRIHRQIIDNNISHKARIGRKTLEDMCLGMTISISKLKVVLKQIKKMEGCLEYCADHGRPSIVQDVAKNGLTMFNKENI